MCQCRLSRQEALDRFTTRRRPHSSPLPTPGNAVADAASRPKVRHKKEMRTWTPEQLRLFLAHVEQADPRSYPLWFLASSTGARRGELLGARWSDLDFDNSRLAIRQTVIAVRNEVRFGEPKTGAGRRNIALDSLTLKVLRRHRSAQAAEKLAAGPAWNNLDLIFQDRDGGTGSSRLDQQEVQEACHRSRGPLDLPS
jgi:integrase